MKQRTLILLFETVCFLFLGFGQSISFQELPSDVIVKRLENAPRRNDHRKERLSELFQQGLRPSGGKDL